MSAAQPTNVLDLIERIDTLIAEAKRGITTEVPDECTVRQATTIAEAAHLHLITDGRRVLLSPIVPPGWHRMAVKIKTPEPPPPDHFRDATKMIKHRQAA